MKTRKYPCGCKDTLPGLKGCKHKYGVPVETHTPTPWMLHEKPNDIYNIESIDNPMIIAQNMKETDADFIVRAVNSHETLLLAAKDALLMIKELSDSLYVKPEMFRKAAPVERLFQAIAQAEGK